MIQEINIYEYMKNRKEPDILVDLREETVFQFGSIPGAVNIPIGKIKELYRLPKDRTVCVFCQAGEISGEIAELLADAGYEACNLTGGYREYLRRSMEAEMGGKL